MGTHWKPGVLLILVWSGKKKKEKGFPSILAQKVQSGMF